MRLLITGAAGNLGSRVARHLSATSHELRLLVHRVPMAFDVSSLGNVAVCQGDLAGRDGLEQACAGSDCVVHLAGVLFAPLPEHFLHKTNVGYVKNLLDAAKAAGVRKFILVSFPHVEGETTPENPATGRLDRIPEVVHFRTRLEAERLVLSECEGSTTVPVIFRAGIVYGRGIKLMEGARWMLRHRLMAVWRRPTWAHLLALPDFLSALQAGIELDSARGIYQVCDDGPLLLQDFLDHFAERIHCPRPWRMPEWVFHAAGVACEAGALLFHRSAPLNRDIIRAGMTSCVADTSRMKRELLPRLAYPTIEEGWEIL